MYDDYSSPLPLCLILPEMDTHFKYIASGNTNANFVVKHKKC